MRKKGFFLFTTLLAIFCLAGVSSAALLGNTLGFPRIDYNNRGTTHYEAAGDLFTVQTSPIAIFLSAADPHIFFQSGGSLTIKVEVDDTGALVGGVTGNDFVLNGAVDLGVEGIKSGVLLTGEVEEFGFYDSYTPTDTFDFRITLTGGELKSLFDGYDIGIVYSSEGSDFAGLFTDDFDGGAKGSIGPIPKLYEPCSLTVDKYCYVPTPPSDDFECEKPIDSLTMIWDGDGSIRIKAWKGDVGSTELLADIDDIDPGEEVTVSDYAGSPNDVYWEIFVAGSNNWLGESTFHLSCSDDDMDGPEDCGMPQGDGKGKTGYINEWILAGMVDSETSFNCLATDPSGDQVSECEVTIPSQVECDGKLKALVLKYMGGDCSNTTNWQEDKFTCSGDAALNEPVRIVITKDAAELTVIPDDESIMIGDEITIVANNELKADTQFDIVQGGVVLQSLNIHTSCSKPLSLGDRFGSVQVVAMDLKDGDYLSTAAEVEYTYVIQNTGPVDVQNITVVDSIFGIVPGSPIASLAKGEQVTLVVSGLVEETTTNFVEVNGETLLGGGVCSATASSTVTVAVPQPECIASGDSELKVGKKKDKKGKKKANKVEWKLYNNGSDTITIETLTLSWPVELGKLKKIKLGHDTIFEPAVGPEPPFGVIDTWKGGVDKRQIKEKDKDGKLKFEFEKKTKTSQYEYAIMVNFLEGCSVEYVPGTVPLDCEKPIDALTMIWNGSQTIRVKAWKGNVGSTLLADIDPVVTGQEVTVNDYAGSPNDVYWEIFDTVTTNKIGESVFHMSCSDQDMNGPEDCGTPQGDGKKNESQYINDWLLEGMVDSTSIFDCNP